MTREEAITVFKAFMDNPLFSDVHKAGFDRQQIYQWEKGERGITLNNAIRLLKALDAVVLVGAGGVIS